MNKRRKGVWDSILKRLSKARPRVFGVPDLHVKNSRRKEVLSLRTFGDIQIWLCREHGSYEVWDVPLDEFIKFAKQVIEKAERNEEADTEADG